MTTAVDTSVLLDVLTDDPNFGKSSEAMLLEARRKGRIIVCEVVIAELRPVLRSDAELMDFLTDLACDFVPSSLESGMKAGELYQKYLANKGNAKRVVADFLVAAHASFFASALLARDRGYYRTYFTGLLLIDPSA